MALMDELRRFRIVDAHIHNWATLVEPRAVVECLDRFNLEAVVDLSNLEGDHTPSPEQVASANLATARLREAVGPRIIPFCYVNAAYVDHAVGEIQRWAREGFRGLKLWVSLRASDPRTSVVVEAAQAQGWPVFFHSYHRTHGAPCPSESTPMEIADLARKHPRAQFIMAHMGAQFEHGLNAVAGCPNVAVDYAGSINEKGAYETALRLLGPERVVFGTDLPACFYTNAGRVLELDAPDAVKQKIFAGNILRTLKTGSG
jgi:uncharacterized protein